jgi:tetratricopeptide (TPR) repeat protein
VARAGAGRPRVTWDDRLAELWASLDDLEEDEFVRRMEELTGELGPDSAVAAFELASAFDSTGHEELAVRNYERALGLGLGDDRRRRAVIQLASSLRNVGRVDESVALLEAERERTSDELDDAVSAFLAFALADAGREREAAAIALAALGPHLPRYQRSVGNYARLLTE